MMIPKKYLKYIAYISMFIDHLAIMLNGQTLISSHVYLIMRGFGRLAFPLFLFFLVQGAAHTQSVQKYIGRIAALAIISEIPYDTYFYKGFPDWSHQNIYFELLICLLLIVLLNRFMKDSDSWPIYFAFFTMIMCVPPYLLHFSYGYKGVIATAFMYLAFREKTHEDLSTDLNGDLISVNKHRVLEIVYMCLACLALTYKSATYQYVGLLVVPLIFLCSNEHIKQSKAMQAAFYLFYPVHLVVLILIKSLLTMQNGFFGV